MIYRYQKIFAIIFLLMLFGFAGYNIYNNYQNKDLIIESVKESIDTDVIINEIKEEHTFNALEETTQSLDKIINDNLVGGHIWNEMYGATYAALGKNEENNFKYIRGKDDIEYFADFWNKPSVPAKELAKRLKRMQDELEPNGTKVVFVLYPPRYDSEFSEGYYGLPYKDYNETADEFLMYLRRYGINYLDYRDIVKEEGLKSTDMYYKTDHHWNVETAFFATTKLVEYMNDTFDLNLDPTGKYCDINSYYDERYKDFFMGSMGREVGEVYGGLDDYVLLTPKFESDVTYSVYKDGFKGTRGTMDQVLISRNHLDQYDLYKKDLNSSYISGVSMADKIENHMADNDISILLLRNSYSSQVAVFLTPMVKSIDMVWGAKVTEKHMMRTIREKPFDYVILAVTADNFDNVELFTFFSEENDAEKAALGIVDDDTEVEE